MVWCGCNAVVARVVDFFFKQKTAYDIWYGLVGSEMCIRDSHGVYPPMSDFLAREQIRVFDKYDAANITSEIDMVAVSYTHLTLPTSDLV